MKRALTLFLFPLFTSGVSRTETDEAEHVSVMEGDSVTLHSNLTEILNDDTILWMFGPKDTLISQIGRKDDLTSLHVTDDVEFRGRLQVDHKSGSLTIRNTRDKHSGQYKLSISRKKTTYKIFIVTVSVVVGGADGVKSVSVSVKEGDPVTLNPDAEIHKDDLMLWRFVEEGILLAKVDIESNETSVNNASERFGDRLKVNQTGSLTIRNTRITDSGLYELQIRGSESLLRFFVTVTALPGPGLFSGAIAGISLGVILPVLLLVATAAAVALVYFCRRIFTVKSQINEEKVSVMEGDSVTLLTDLETLGDCTVEWWYGVEDNLIARISGGSENIYDGADGRFRSKLNFNDKGDLIISNTRTMHSGLYKLKISSSRKPIHKRFVVTISVKSVSVKEGKYVTLQIDVKIQGDDLILWTFGATNLLVIRATPTGTISTSERFNNRLELDHQTGSLTINNITTADSGHFKLQIITHNKTTFRRFNVIVDGNEASDSVTEEDALLGGDDADGGNRQEVTSPL